MIKKKPINLIKSNFEDLFYNQIKNLKLKLPVREYKFCSYRRWRSDFCWIEERIIFEIEGGIFSRGRHIQSIGFIKDCEKYNMASLLGYRIFRIIPAQVKNGEGISLLISALQEFSIDEK